MAVGKSHVEDQATETVLKTLHSQLDRNQDGFISPDECVARFFLLPPVSPSVSSPSRHSLPLLTTPNPNDYQILCFFYITGRLTRWRAGQSIVAAKAKVIAGAIIAGVIPAENDPPQTSSTGDQ